MFCSKCGDIYRRIAWNNRGKHSVVWRCCTRVQHGPKACDAETIPEDELQEVTVKAFNQLYQHKESVSEVLMSNIKKVIYESNNRLALIDDQLQELQKELLKKANNNQKYDEQLVRTYIEKITVYNDHFTVEFKAGFKFDIER